VTEANRTTAPPDAFHFGRNWQRYVERYLNPTRERIARQSLIELLEADLSGRTFLDIGAGSGLFSLCAYQLGAKRIVSVDVDAESAESCRALRTSVGDPPHWEVIQGSILDRALLERVALADVVYSWGVLHHTGDMYTAIRNASQLVAMDGIFAIAIYNHARGRRLDSTRWLAIKRTYNRLPRSAQIASELAYQAAWFVNELRHGRNPMRMAREYKRSRGMARRTDLIDWLGGYPYEFAAAEAIVEFCERECGLRAEKVLSVPPTGTGNNQFVFRRVG